MITIKPLTSNCYDVTQLGNVYEDKIEKLMDLMHQNYPGQTTLVLKANGFTASHVAEEKALALAGITDSFAAAKQTATGRITF